MLSHLRSDKNCVFNASVVYQVRYLLRQVTLTFAANDVMKMAKMMSDYVH